MAKEKRYCWIVQQCQFGSAVQSVIILPHAAADGHVPTLSERLQDALTSAGLESGVCGSVSYLDMSIKDLASPAPAKLFGGIVPCRSIWDASGKRLAAVLILGSSTAPGI